ncbi:adiponectin receptor protein 1 [Trypanosoma grayi]|uniref:adiponectin receptor protein 1 n=1 Tax=Trypanosoma grayi TaxID=71804 RepID=UPI0004F44FDB|nr:adiponectin receptor protein 1 [Trypanosoma grayi]KEG11739.1 adiponectin receptor protein 1 [Trypanosoma grayi]
MHKAKGLPLYKKDEFCVPDCLKENPYILTGYRAQYTTGMCIRSFFALHNETVNIWTHGIGFLVFVLLSLVLFTTVLLTHEYLAHTFVYGIFCFGCLMCMACSTTYHLFLGHRNQLLSLVAQQLDYYGISVLIVVSFLPPLYIGFYCEPFFRAIYMTAICICGVLSLVATSLPCLHDGKVRWVRICIYTAMALSGVVPFFHHILLNPMNAETLQTCGGVALMFILYGMGTMIYCLRIPECWYPGEFDLLFSSHQIWHVFVLAAACVHFFTCTAIYQQWAVSRGAC